MSRASEYATAVSNLLAQQGEAYGRAAANKGQIWGGALSNIGSYISQIPQQQAELARAKNQAEETALRRQELERQATRSAQEDAEDQKIRDLFAQPELPKPDVILRTVGPKKGIPIINGLAALRMDPQGDPEKSLKLLQQVANGLNALPEDLRAQAYPDIVKSFEQRGIIKPGMLQPEYSPDYWKFIMGTGQEPPKPAPPKADYTIGNQRFSGETNQPIATGEQKPANAPNVGSFEDYVLRTYGQNPTPEQVLAARKAYGQADDRPRVSVSMSGMGGADRLTPEAIADTATRYRIFGQTAIPTRIEGPERVRIMNEAANQQRALGQSAAQAVQKQAAFKSDAAALTKMSTMKASAESFENKAINQAGLVSELSKKVGRSSYPIINSALLAGKQQIAGDTDTQLLFNALSTFTAEYAKIMEGSTGSVAAASDSARKSAAELIGRGLSNNTMQATLAQMQKEMRWTIQGYDATIEHITDRMGGGASPNNPYAPQQPATPAAAPSTGGLTYQDYLKSKGQK